MRFLALSITFGIVVALAGCAATGPVFAPATPPAGDQTLVYIYRPATWAIRGMDASFAIDGTHAASLSIEGYTRFYVKSGHRGMTVSFSVLALLPDSHRAIYFAPGATMYLKLTTGSQYTGTGTKLSYTLQGVSSYAAEQEITSYKFQAPAQDIF